MPDVYEMGAGEYSLGKAKRVTLFKKAVKALVGIMLKTINLTYGSIPKFALAMAKIAAGVIVPAAITKYSPKVIKALENKFRKQTIDRIKKIVGILNKIAKFISRVLNAALEINKKFLS